MVTVSSLAADPEATRSIHSAGEELALSAVFEKPATGGKKSK